MQIEVGMRIHAGLAVKGGAGFSGIVTSIEGDMIHFRSEVESRFGFRTFKAHISVVSIA